MRFIKYNANPKGWKTGDCVVRAIAQANNTSWEVTYQQLCEIGLKKCRMPNDKQTYEALLKQYGWVKQKMPRHTDGTRYTVEELSYEISPTRTVIISVAHHLTCLKQNVLMDTWDCRNKSVGNYWIKEDNDFCITLDEMNKKVRRVLL